MITKTPKLLFLALVSLALLGACRGQPSREAPRRVFDDMDEQPRFQPQEVSTHFADGRAMRAPVPGTVAQGQLREDAALYLGKIGEHAWVGRVPLPVDEKLLRRGQNRFQIFCAPCHDSAGTGQGIVMQRASGAKGGFPAPPLAYAERVPQLADGEIFHIISNGVRNMPGYRTQIPVEDRWAIVAWTRVLARSQGAQVADVPSDLRSSILPETP